MQEQASVAGNAIRSSRLTLAVAVLLASVCIIVLWRAASTRDVPGQRVATTAQDDASRKNARVRGTYAPCAGAGAASGQLSFAGLKAAAERGDPAAMRMLAELASSCASMGRDMRGSLRAVELGIVRDDAANASAYANAGQRLMERCAGVAPGHDDLRGFATAWRQRAADAGDLAAKVRVHRYQQDNDPDVVAVLLDEVIAAGDPAAMMEIGRLLLSYPMDGRSLPGYEGLVFTEFDVYALEIIACERGIDCRQGSPKMDEICLTGLQCREEDFSALLQHNLGQGSEQAALESALLRMRGLLEGR